MRVSVMLSTATVMALISSGASAMDANEIFNRLQAQAGSSETVQANTATTRGFNTGALYGAEEAPAAAPESSVVAVPSSSPATATASRPATTAIVVPETYVSAVDPASAPERLTEPSYTMEVTSAPSVTVAAPSYVEQQAISFQPSPSYAQIPSFSAVETQQAMRPTAASYSAVDQEERIDLRIFFEWNSASLKPEAIGQLAELCTAIRRVGASADNRFKIIGHTDKSGSDEYNLYLSNARAREVKRHLVEECSLPAEALLAVGEGERQSSPNAPANAPEERRVEIQFVS